MGQGPEYYDIDRGYIVSGVRVARKDSVPLKDVLGTYRWVWEDQAYEEWTYHQMDEVKESSKVVLEAIDAHPNSDLTPDKIKGRFDMASLHISFTGLQPWNTSSPNYAHAYDLLEPVLEDKYTQDEFEEDGHSLCVLDVKDDNGHHFVKFTWYAGYMGCAPFYGWLIAKRYEPRESGEGEWKELSEEERNRLGMGLSDGELKRRAEGERVKDEEKDEKGIVVKEEVAEIQETRHKRELSLGMKVEDEPQKRVKVES
ncbi:hypothetical protein BXZ70DRAFT_907914 [Cristinia sonorae]|uniref:Uncharacterized protein n=1 Tax=Cristinia sonorae TaxID=1940300 RepID=A0A8K0XPG2_9AGAR|nr:hypothetical protein BXZ70DRAFT_907914 [Cristinia sonorae]